MAKKKKSSPKAVVKPAGWPEVEIPNESVLNSAHQYRDATIALFRDPHAVVQPLYTLGGFALELYLKSLNAKWVFEQDSIDPHADPIGLIVTAEPVTHGHVLLDLFDDLHPTIQAELEDAYKLKSIVENAPNFRAALANYEGSFENSRYIFEHHRPFPKGSLNEFIAFIQFLGGFVGQLPKRTASRF